ncbi:hypothetical protein ACFHWD_06070 [Clostridium sp. MT-14]|uniref:Uncharacterized protein n=1 Tax=Clostridium aromativorans TaxID=2836848 RepID=A0ABS8N2D5_9CLOT|nr:MULTISPECIES: hypothetical protein [Clostridium]KAA8675170.1 hypothetical protein F3O63_05220 [Clostridium sp. HV4-5-A1G]MCC9293962.1 hypothetical protein [Clostridium aromativorans]CAB1241906.1 conserved exported hypothetical protein [Clostridiaceae bacterium BL-3]
MKLGKKTAVVISFTIGIAMFATTAFAEVTSKSGYDQLKDSVKYTAKACTGGLSSYTADMSFVIKDGTNTVYSSDNIFKYDLSNKSKEDISTVYNGSKKAENYYYMDKNSIINKPKDSPSYYVTNYTDGTNWNITNPFDEDRASDIEKIADAIVGNLKDSVSVNVKQDGSREISGSLNNTQIPSLINALVSFQFKNSFAESTGRTGDRISVPKLTNNIFVKNVKGTASVDKNGLIKTILGSGVISGTDKNGQNHNLTFELLLKISGINSTAVKKPDLSGKKTIVQTAKSSETDKLSNPEKYLGKYTHNIVIEKDGKFIKIGEGTVNIEKIDTNTVSGTYEAKYIKGYEEGNQKLNFSGSFDKQKIGGNDFNADITATADAKGTVKGNLYLDPNYAGIQFSIEGNTLTNSDSQYNKVFD